MVFDVEKAKNYLQSLKDEKPGQRDTMKRAVSELAPVIRELLERGYTRKRIHELLSERFDLDISYNTFRCYLYQAERSGGDRPDGPDE